MTKPKDEDDWFYNTFDYLPIDVILDEGELFTVDLLPLEEVKCTCGWDSVYGKGNKLHERHCKKYSVDDGNKP